MTANSDATLAQKPKWYQPATQLQWWLTWVYIIIGITIMCSGFVLFINPYHIVPGGVYGAGIVLHSLFPSIQVGTFGWFFDIPLLTLSAIFLGSKIGSRTIFAAMLAPFMMNALDWLAYPNEAAIKVLDPTQLLGGVINMSDHLMLTTIIGAATIGLGCGLVVRQQATTGGTDIVGMFLQKYLNIRFSNGILICDAAVVLSGLLVFGLGLGHVDSANTNPSWHLSFYSLIAIFVSAKTIAYVINGAQDDKLMFVVSNKPNEEFRQFILQTLDRSATRIKSSGLYSNDDKEMLFLVVSNKEIPAVKLKIQEVDPNAFVVVSDAHAAYGEGWRPLPLPGEITAE